MEGAAGIKNNIIRYGIDEDYEERKINKMQQLDLYY
jgi:hypothetical protein